MKERMKRFTDESYDDLDDNIGIVMPILTECDVDEDFTDGIDKVGNVVPILPLRNMVLFPGVAMPVIVGRPKSMRLIKEAVHNKSLIGVVCQKEVNTEDPEYNDLYTTGVIADIVRVLEMPDGTTTVILQGKKRFSLDALEETEPYLKGKITLLEDRMPDKTDREFEALISTIKDLTIKMLGSMSEPPRDLIFSIKNNKNVLYLVNFSCSNIPSGASEKQELLLIGDLKDRAYRLLFILNREYQLVELKASIQMKTHEDINQQQREYFLQQQIKTIQEELGGNINELEIKELREKARKKKWPASVAEIFEKEVRKLERLHPQSPDFSIQTQYVQTIVNLPWNEYSKDNFNLVHAQKVLDRDHYGLEKVKERIIEHLAVLKLKGDMKSPTVKVADKEIEKKKYAQKGTYAALFPQINFTADYTRTLKKQVMYMDGFDMGGGSDEPTPGMEGIDMSKGIEVGRDNNWTTGFNLSMPLVNATLWKSLSISALDVELSIEQARSSKISMVNQVKKSFYAVLLANDSYRVFKESYDNAMENYLDIKKKYDQGTVAEYDLIRADVTVKNSEPNMLQAENSLTLAKWQLKALLGMDLEMAIDCEGELADFESVLFADYMATDTTLAGNTDLKQIDLQMQQLKKTLTMQKFDYLPTLSLTGMYQWNAMNNDFKFKNYNWTPYSIVGVSLTVPIFSGGSKYHKIKQTQVSMHQMDLQRDDTKRNLQLAIKQYLDNMKTCVKQFDAAQKGVEQANKGYKIAQKRYDTGAGTLLEMNDAELALTQAKLNLNQSIYNYMVAKSDMEKVLGQEQTN